MAPVTAGGYRRTISVHVRPCNLRDHPGSLRPMATDFVTHLAFRRNFLVFRHPAHRLGVLGHSGSSSVPTSPLPPARSQLIDDARHLASFGAGPSRAPSERAPCAPRCRPPDITTLLTSTTPRHRATARARADLPRRRRRCRSRCRRASPMIALSRTRRLLTPRAALAYGLRAAATSVASPRYSSSP